MRTFTLFIILIILLAELKAQTGCGNLINSVMPPTPYSEGYLLFDGLGDFLRTSDLNSLEFPASTTDSFTISAKLKVNSNQGLPQYIFGKRNTAGWIFGYSVNETGYISILIGSEWKNIYNLAGDTSWHSYEVKYRKQTQELRTYTDGILTNLYTGFTYTDMQNSAAFSVGNVGFLPQYGVHSVTLTGNWFRGAVDYITVKVNVNRVVNYSFNEGAGQVALDSGAYSYSDRTMPGEQTCGASHMMLGYMLSQDTCDPEWVTGEYAASGRFQTLGEGTRYFYSQGGMEFFAQHFSVAMTNWNGYLVNGGYFNLAGSVQANNIAKWDGGSWSAIGGGFNHEAFGLAVYKNELWATGIFDSAYGAGARNYISRWDGSQWQDVSGGLNSVGTVMKEFNGSLVVGGFFTSVGQMYTPYIARWNGSEWQRMGIGMSGPVYSLEIFNNELYAGGNFVYAGGQVCNGIARWNGTEWQPVGAGTAGGDRTVYSLKVYNGELYAGGAFITMNGVFCYNIAKYDGQIWKTAGAGARGYNCAVSQGFVSDMEVTAGELYAVGMFTTMNGTPANKFAKYNGSSWCGIEYGMDLRPRSIELYNNELIINGDFYSVSGIRANNIIKYTPVPNLTGSGNGNSIIPEKFGLGQNYPNPFNPSTKIEFRIADLGYVLLRVFDITGKEVSAPVNRELKPGIYNIDFDGSALPSGVYFYSLVTQGYKETRKMVLVK